MSFSRQEFTNGFGRAAFVSPRAEVLLTFVTFAGNPTGNVVPEFIGQELFDSSTQRFYKACGTTTADWKLQTA